MNEGHITTNRGGKGGDDVLLPLAVEMDDETAVVGDADEDLLDYDKDFSKDMGILNIYVSKPDERCTNGTALMMLMADVLAMVLMMITVVALLTRDP